MKIKNYLSPEHHKLLKKITSNTSIVICPADKGKVIVIQDSDNYLSKLPDQLHGGD